VVIGWRSVSALGRGRGLDRFRRPGRPASRARAAGFDPARVMLPGALAGAALLLAPTSPCGSCRRAVELKVGVVTALIGVPSSSP
jgi:hypothetical protein